jgi:hypothetical protein
MGCGPKPRRIGEEDVTGAVREYGDGLFHGMLPERRVSFQRRSHEEKAEEKGYAKSQRGACNQC